MNIPKIYITDDDVRACLRMFPHLKARATWHAAFMKAEHSSTKRVDGSVIMHIKPSCCGMKSPKIIFIHCKVVRHVNWCAHCVSNPGLIWHVISEVAPEDQQQGNRVAPIWSFERR